MWISAVRAGVDVRILDIKTQGVDIDTDILIIYCICETGVIALDTDPSNFTINE